MTRKSNPVIRPASNKAVKPKEKVIRHLGRVLDPENDLVPLGSVQPPACWLEDENDTESQALLKIWAELLNDFDGFSFPRSACYSLELIVNIIHLFRQDPSNIQLQSQYRASLKEFEAIPKIKPVELSDAEKSKQLFIATVRRPDRPGDE